MLDRLLKAFTRSPESTEITLRLAQRLMKKPELATDADIRSLAGSVIRQAKR
jgi:hypothetical protein